jgi:hypothetical protein
MRQEQLLHIFLIIAVNMLKYQNQHLQSAFSYYGVYLMHGCLITFYQLIIICLGDHVTFNQLTC